MTDFVLHVGAHRTGTTYLQNFLTANAQALEEKGIQVLCPPKTRRMNLESVSFSGDRVVLSDENILGTMEGNISEASLYPDARGCLLRYRDVLDQAGVIYLTIRSFHEWWASAISFCAKRGCTIPNHSDLAQMAYGSRTWDDVIDDIVSLAPNAKVFVREFEWKKDTPKQHLHKMTGWPEWNNTRLNKKVHNRRPGLAEIAEALLDKNDSKGLEALPLGDVYQPFSTDQVNSMWEGYLEDIKKIRSRDDVVFFGDLPEPNRSAPSPISNPDKNTKKILLHVSKTGIDRLKRALDSKNYEASSLFICGHGDTLTSTSKIYGRNRKLAFTFRDPIDRFVLSFNARKRQGRPAYNVVWTPAEAVSFSYFSTANDLAEALSDTDERMKSAAYFAFNSIFHLKHNYRYFLHSSGALLYEHRNHNIIVCCEGGRIEENAEKISNALEFDLSGRSLSEGSSAALEKPDLSEKAVENIKEYWAREFEIYETCRFISSELGFS